MSPLARFTLDGANSGVYAAPAAPGMLEQQAVESGLAWLDFGLAGVASKADFLARSQTVFRLPPTFGHNWDALADCLEDLAWLPARGYVVSIHNGAGFARRAPRDFATALEILGAAASYWKANRALFAVFLDAETARWCNVVPPPFPVQ